MTRSFKTAEDQKIAWRLYADKPWLMRREDQFIELLEYAEMFNSKKLVYSLLERFTCVNDETKGLYLQLIANYIVNDSGFKEDEIVIVAVTSGSSSDSGQGISNCLKVYLKKAGWSNFLTCNRSNYANSKCDNTRNKIILVDEFLGTGVTLHRVINDVKGQCKKFNPEILVCIIAGMEEGINKIRKEGTNIFCPLELKKGISDYSNESEIDIAIAAMISMESGLENKYDNYDMTKYSLGFNKSESLFAFENESANIPNNNFPIFWWDFYSGMRKRGVLFERFDEK